MQGFCAILPVFLAPESRPCAIETHAAPPDGAYSASPMYGGPTEYANADNRYPIAYDLVPVGKCYDTEYIKIRNAPHWAEPNVQSVSELLRKIVEDSMRFQVAQKARETADLFNWEAATQKLLILMRELF